MMTPYFQNEWVTLYHGDSLEIIPQLKKKIDLVYTDPPYKIHTRGGKWFDKRDYLKNIEEVGIDFDPYVFFDKLKFLNIDPINMYSWCSLKQLVCYQNWAIAREYHFNFLVWHKTNPPPLHNNTYLSDTEYLPYIRKSGAYFNSKLTKNHYRKYFITINNKSQYGHPTEKPLGIVDTQIKISCPEGGLVLDPFFGSGTTGVACQQNKVHCIGIEINEKYCEIAVKRLTSTPEVLF